MDMTNTNVLVVLNYNDYSINYIEVDNEFDKALYLKAKEKHINENKMLKMADRVYMTTREYMFVSTDIYELTSIQNEVDYILHCMFQYR